MLRLGMRFLPRLDAAQDDFIGPCSAALREFTRFWILR